jgi:hypothetical protein
MELQHCKTCNQMTNHDDKGECLKCPANKVIGCCDTAVKVYVQGCRTFNHDIKNFGVICMTCHRVWYATEGKQ